MNVLKKFTELVFQGKNYTSLQKAVAETIALNEVSDSINTALKLSAAPTSKSGYSFGGNQLDLGIKLNKKGKKTINTHAAKMFVDIMKNAVDKEGNKIISDKFFNELAKLNSKGELIGGAITEIGDKRTLTEKQLLTINKALASDYGKGAITKDFMKEIVDRIKKVSSLINTKIKSPEIKTSLKKSKALMVLVDYDNQFNISPNGKMMKFLKKAENNNNFGSEKIKNWILTKTTYGKKKPGDIQKRQGRLETVFKKYYGQSTSKNKDVVQSLADEMRDRLNKLQKNHSQQKCYATPPTSSIFKSTRRGQSR